MKRSAFYGWRLLAAFWFIYLVNLGFPTYGQSVINAYMAKDLHLDRTMLGLAFSLYMLIVGLPGPAVAAIVNRIGVRMTLLIGCCSAMLGALSMALFVHTGWQAVVTFGILIGFGSCAGGAIAEQQGIAQWFIRKRALALSLMYSGGGIGAEAELAPGKTRPKGVFVTTEAWTFKEAIFSRAFILMLVLGMVLVVHATSAADLYPFPILLGFGWGATLVSMMGAPMNYFGLKAYPAVIGLWLAIQTGIGAVAPFVVGYVFDKYGSYTPVFYSIAGLCFAGSLLLLLATPPRRKASDEAPARHAAWRPARA